MDCKILTLADGEQVEFQIAFVPDPAILSNAMAFNESRNHYKFQEVEGSKNLIMGYFMIADLPIGRYDAKVGHYDVMFKKEGITKIVKNWNFNGLNKNLNELHQTNEFSKGVYVLSNWQIDSELGIMPPKGFKVEPDGSWFGIIDTAGNQEIKQKFLDGTYTGFSVESRDFIEVKDDLDILLSSLTSEQKK